MPKIQIFSSLRLFARCQSIGRCAKSSGFCGLPLGIDPVKYAVRFGWAQNARSTLGDFVCHIPADKIASETPSRDRSLRKAARFAVAHRLIDDTNVSFNP